MLILSVLSVYFGSLFILEVMNKEKNSVTMMRATMTDANTVANSSVPLVVKSYYSRLSNIL